MAWEAWNTCSWALIPSQGLSPVTGLWANLLPSVGLGAAWWLT